MVSAGALAAIWRDLQPRSGLPDQSDRRPCSDISGRATISYRNPAYEDSSPVLSSDNGSRNADPCTCTPARDKSARKIGPTTVANSAMTSDRTSLDSRGEFGAVVGWRRGRLLAAGFDPDLAARLAGDCGIDLHALLELIDRGCPPALAARILAPLDEESRRC